MSILQPVRCKIDPGSTTTGLAIVREEEKNQVVLFLFELTHRGSNIRDALKARSGKRRRRRFHLKYRAKRFSNRRRPEGWLAPSLQHRIENILTWINRFRKRTLLTAISCEKVRFDTQKLLDPEVSGIQYAQGTLFGYEVHEYLLEKWDRKCAYCDATNIPLEIDQIIHQSRGGSNRVDNLTLACGTCNQKKGNQTVETFCPQKAKTIRSKPSLQASAAVNSTRLALFDLLSRLPIPCEEGTGGQTKYNRARLGIPKTHALDAACTGTVFDLGNWQIHTQRIISTSRGAYQRTRLDRFGFPRGFLLRQKQVHGFQTGDLVVASVPSGKKTGHHIGRLYPTRPETWNFDRAKTARIDDRKLVHISNINQFTIIDSSEFSRGSKSKFQAAWGIAVRASGYFNIQTSKGVVQGVSSKHCRLVQRADGYHYAKDTLSQQVTNETHINQLKEQRFLPVLKDRVSALSKR